MQDPGRMINDDSNITKRTLSISYVHHNIATFSGIKYFHKVKFYLLRDKKKDSDGRKASAIYCFREQGKGRLESKSQTRQ